MSDQKQIFDKMQDIYNTRLSVYNMPQQHVQWKR